MLGRPGRVEPVEQRRTHPARPLALGPEHVAGHDQRVVVAEEGGQGDVAAAAGSRRTFGRRSPPERVHRAGRARRACARDVLDRAFSRAISWSNNAVRAALYVWNRSARSTARFLLGLVLWPGHGPASSGRTDRSRRGGDVLGGDPYLKRVRMGNGTMRWTADQLDRIDAEDELQITLTRADGTLRAYRKVWVVRVGDDLYVRSVNGRGADWFRHVMAAGRGRNPLAGGVEADVMADERGEASAGGGRRRIPDEVCAVRGAVGPNHAATAGRRGHPAAGARDYAVSRPGSDRAARPRACPPVGPHPW